MRSSEGCSARQSRYSANTADCAWALAIRSSMSGISLDSSLRPSSIRSRSASWSSSGMPRSMPIVRIGMKAPRSWMKSKPPEPTRGSRVVAQNSRIFGSMAAIRRGVNTRERRPRCSSWVGGSSKMIEPGGTSMSAFSSSSTVPRAEL